MPPSRCWLKLRKPNRIHFNLEETMHSSETKKLPTKVTACALTFALLAFGLGVPAKAGDVLDKSADAIKTATPIKHVIIIVGENRSFDHLYATYVPKSKSEKVLNLLSEGIINAG
jgi:phospholipase C